MLNQLNAFDMPDSFHQPRDRRRTCQAVDLAFQWKMHYFQDAIPLMHTCKNCNQRFERNFCNNCGQKVGVRRLTGKVILDEIADIFTHIEHGFLNSSKQLILQPGKFTKEYLDGKRKEKQKPVSYLVIWVALEWIIRTAIIKASNYQTTIQPGVSISYGEGTIFYNQHSVVFIFIIVPVIATLFYFILSRPRYNFSESLVLCFYGLGTYYIIQLLFSTLLQGLFLHINILSWQQGYFILFLGAAWSGWAMYDFYKRIRMKYFWPRLIICALACDIAVYAVIIYGPIVWFWINGK